VNLDLPASKFLVVAIVIDDARATLNLEAESVVAISVTLVAGPDLEHVVVSGAVRVSVDRALAFEHGVVTSGDDQPIVRGRVEVQTTGLEPELSVASGNLLIKVTTELKMVRY
jgi:hypothetical protein